MLSVFLLTVVVVTSCRAGVATDNTTNQTSVILDGAVHATQRMTAQCASQRSARFPDSISRLMISDRGC